MLTYGFIGLGNMSTAIIKGMLASGDIQPKQIIGFNRSENKTKQLVENFHIESASSLEELSAKSKVLVLGVKPQNLDELLPALTPFLTPNHIIVSIAAGKSLDYLQTNLPNDTAIFRIMPNINAIVGASTSCYCTNSTDASVKKVVEDVFEKVGTILELPENLFSTFTSIACASPAFTYMYIDSLARAAVKEGMPREMALQAAASSVLGSAKMVLESDAHPMALVDQVCSPGGTTIRGVMALQQEQFEATVHKAVQAVSDRDAELNKG